MCYLEIYGRWKINNISDVVFRCIKSHRRAYIVHDIVLKQLKFLDKSLAI